MGQRRASGPRVSRLPTSRPADPASRELVARDRALHHLDPVHLVGPRALDRAASPSVMHTLELIRTGTDLALLVVMLNRTRALIIAIAIGNAMCSPYLPPTTVPPAPVPSTELDAFRTALQAYVDQTQPYRKQAAQAGNRIPGQTGAAANAEIGLRTRQDTLADALKT